MGNDMKRRIQKEVNQRLSETLFASEGDRDILTAILESEKIKENNDDSKYRNY